MEDYLQKEMQASKIVGSFPSSTANCIHVSRFGKIPKKNHPGKWRLITNISFPEETSVNNAIDSSQIMQKKGPRVPTDTLQHACRVIPQGQALSREAISLLSIMKQCSPE